MKLYEYKYAILSYCNQVLKQWCNETIVHRYGVQFTAAQLDGLWAVLVSVFLIGGILGGIAGGRLADVLGR